MEKNFKATYFAVLLTVSLAIASPALGAGMKVITTDDSVVLPDLSPNEGYTGGYTTLTTPEPFVTDIANLNFDLSPNEGYRGGDSQQDNSNISVADASKLNFDLSPNEAYNGGYSAQIAGEVSSTVRTHANAVGSRKSLHAGGGQ